jgi:putative nucleotidyltransferase with HDIG domain
MRTKETAAAKAGIRSRKILSSPGKIWWLGFLSGVIVILAIFLPIDNLNRILPGYQTYHTILEMVAVFAVSAYLLRKLFISHRGEQRLFAFNDMQVQNKQGINTGEFFPGLDITELIRAEQAREKAYEDLSAAYDSTINGWSAALDLRDHETEGHSRRVAALTLHLASWVGFSDEQLVHIRRGALLHDIGKMGIPDAILRKAGPLNEQEWKIMRTHPQVAYELLLPINYLRPALDIPYCHHERWDGSGYPRGLKGEEIPLAARIFALADVWDALNSDRPYRAAWPRERVLDYIALRNGTHFDPQLVDLFIQRIDDLDSEQLLAKTAQL